MRIVLDTNILVRATARARGPARLTYEEIAVYSEMVFTGVPMGRWPTNGNENSHGNRSLTVAAR